MEVANQHYSNGYCSMYGVGGKVSFFGEGIPQPNNVPAQKLTTEDYNTLIDICGETWRSTNFACCDSEQLTQLKSNLAKADPLISSCPACKENFYQLFCHFTCSPNQSQFIDIVSTQTALNGVEVVDELNYYIDPDFGSPFFDSCKNIKFGLTNGYAMDLIGGGAQNYTDFLKFLGDKKPQLGGSPFQITFKTSIEENDNSNLTLFETNIRDCNDSDPMFACACSDCPQVCPTLTELPQPNQCVKFNMSCQSFVILMAYVILSISYFCILTLLRYRNKNKLKNSILLTDDNDVLESSILQTEISPELGDASFNFSNTINLISLHSRKSYIVNNFLEKIFYKLGLFCSTYPRLVLFYSTAFVVLFSFCMFFIEFETNPVNLWVSPTADAFIEKQKYDESFEPFYRTQQIILSNSTGESILQDYNFVEWWFNKEFEILQLSANVTIDGVDHSVKYDDICFKPLEDTCILESFTQYFDGDLSNLPESSDWRQKIYNCAKSPVECLPSFQQPLKKNLLFGGNENDDVLTSRAIIITLLNNNDNNPYSYQVVKSSKWEAKLEEYVLNNLIPEASARGLNLSFNTEISLEKELNKSTNTDIKIVIISYLVMFAYASYALSINRNNGKQISFINFSFVTPFGKISGNNVILAYLTKTRLSLGFMGILIVLFSVFTSMGFWSILGLKSTLIITEVIPFLILAVGVDNIFLICNEYSNIESLTITSSLKLNEKVAKTMSSIGPSILLSSLCQFICFVLGSFVGMPAVKNFSLYTSVAVIFNTLLQVTTFVSIFTLDQQRYEDGRLDLIPFIRIENNAISLPVDPENVDENSNYMNNSITQMLNESNNHNNGVIKDFFQEKFGPFIFKPQVRNTIFFIFFTIFGVSLSLIPNIKLGLDQRIALPSDSYLINYFDDIYNYLDIGPPIYFVVEELDVTKREHQQQLCSKFTTCDEFSLVNIIEQEYKRSNISTIAEPVSSWIDDFLMWLNPTLNDCCTIKKNTPNKEFCPPFSSPRLCDSCYAHREWDYQMHGFPQGDEFMEFFDAWLRAPSNPCPLGGKAPYQNAIYKENGTIIRTAFRTSHTPLRSQEDFISAYHSSLRITREVEENQAGMKLFAYSPFYIFFVQYETIRELTFKLLAIGLICVGFISMALLGSLRNSLVFVFNLILIMITILGWMSLAEISLNAVSLVNLLICLGLSVEFSIHLFKHFNFNDVQLGNGRNSYKQNRAYESLVYIGSTTLGGITFTKLIGIGVLSFTKSKIFRVYYFKMWAGLIVIASVHALVLAPLLLGIFGSNAIYGKSKWSKVSYDNILHTSNENSDQDD